MDGVVAQCLPALPGLEAARTRETRLGGRQPAEALAHVFSRRIVSRVKVRLEGAKSEEVGGVVGAATVDLRMPEVEQLE